MPGQCGAGANVIENRKIGLYKERLKARTGYALNAFGAETYGALGDKCLLGSTRRRSTGRSTRSIGRGAAEVDTAEVDRAEVDTAEHAQHRARGGEGRHGGGRHGGC